MLDIAVLSMAMSQAALYQNVQMSLTKTALDTAEQSAQRTRRHGAGATSRFRTSY
nr:YjfB family protein [Bacillus licheniformis]